jgi:hypothetical protein
MHTVARNLSADEVPFGEVGDLDAPFNRVVASKDSPHCMATKEEGEYSLLSVYNEFIQ